MAGEKSKPKQNGRDKRKEAQFSEKDEEVYTAGFDWQVTKRMAGYVAPHKAKIYWAMLAALLSVFANIAGPPLVGYAVDEGVRKGNLSLIGLGVLGYMVVQAIGALGFRTQIILMAIAGQRAIQAMRDDLFVHVNRLSMSFFSQYKTGRLIARIINDVMVLREAITFAVVGTFRDVLILVGIIIAMALINLTLTGMSVAPPRLMFSMAL